MGSLFSTIMDRYKKDDINDVEYINDKSNKTKMLLSAAALGAAAIYKIRKTDLQDIERLYKNVDSLFVLGKNLKDKLSEKTFSDRLRSENGFVKSILEDVIAGGEKTLKDYHANTKYRLDPYFKTEIEEFIEDIIAIRNIRSKDIENEVGRFKTFSFQDKIIDVSKHIDLIKNNADITEEELRDIAKEYSDNGEEFVNKLFEHFKEFKDFDKRLKSNTFIGYDEIANILIEDYDQKGKFLFKRDKSIVHDKRYATLNDLIKAHDSGIKLRESLDQDTIDFLKKTIEANKDVGNIIISKRIFVDDTGNIYDLSLPYRYFKNFINANSDNIIAKTLHFTDVFKTISKPGYYVYKRGEYAPFLKDIAPVDEEGRLGKTLYFIGSKFYDVTGKAVSDEKFKLISAQYGTRGRVYKRMLGLSEERTRYNKDTFLGKILDKLDIGSQESASIFDKLYSFIHRAENEKSIRNIYKKIKNGTATAKDFEVLTRKINYESYILDRYTYNTVLSELLKTDSLDEISKKLSSIDFSDIKTIEKSLNSIVHEKNDYQNIYLDMLFKSYERDKRSVLRRRISVKYSDSVFFDQIGILNSHRTLLGHEIIMREVQKEVLYRNEAQVLEILDSLIKKGKISKKQYNDAKNLILATKLNTRFNNVSEIVKEYAEQEAKNIIKEIKQHYDDSLKSFVKKYGSSYNDNLFFFLEKEEKNKNKIKYVPIKRKSVINKKNVIQYIKDINENIKLAAEGKKAKNDSFWFFKGIYKELRAGKNDPKNISNFSIASFFYFERLNELLANVGLGFSDKSMSSTLDIAKSFMTKRILPTVLTYQALKYLDFEVENFTGESASSRLYGGYTTFKIAGHKIADITGFRGFYNRLNKIITPLSYLDEDGLLSTEEYKDYLQNGYDPIRRSRYWLFGSSTAFFGEGIEYWRPTRYRLIKSNYMYTDVMYGSKKEYWKNHWLPTPRYPLAPLRHFIFDPYHWERKHYEDRPYPISSGLISDDTPFSPIVNSIGNIIKPKIRMHKAEMLAINIKNNKIIKSINDSIKQKAQERDNEYIMAVGSSGDIEPQVFVPTAQANENELILTSNYIYNPKSGFTIDNSYAESSAAKGIVALGKETSNYTFIAKDGSVTKGTNIIKAINQSIKSRAKKADLISGAFYDYKMPAISKMKIIEEDESLIDYGYGGTRKALSDFAFSQKEVLGIFGFLADTILDDEQAVKGKVYESAGSMTSVSRWFYDKSIGGLGQDLNEFTRRIIQKQDKSVIKVNPLKNKMPSWMPEEFRKGDPYTKVKLGEARLPGAGYESLNKLHPDMFGKYGAFDRFKILADVAPYSEEYKIWKNIASQTVTDERLRKEMQKIKKRVARQKETHRFFEYKFKNLKTEKHKGTVVKIIDSNTFIVSGMEDTPIKMAGIKFTKENGGISTVLNVGDKVTIEYSKDDKKTGTYKKLNAVVYKGNKNLNLYAINNNLGKEKENDNSVAGIKARFGKGEIFFGKIFETIAHLNTPIHTKFLKVRSPLEEYTRTEIYGRPYQSWSTPIKSFVLPSLRSAWGNHNPLTAFISSYTAGFITGIFFGRPSKVAKYFGIIGVAGSLFNTLKYVITRKEYIPKEIKKMREIEEYYDALKYEKYKRLYKRAAKLAKRYEGVDIDKVLIKYKAETIKNRKIVDALETKKKELYMQQNYYNEESNKDIRLQIREINKKIKVLSSPKFAFAPGKYTFAALFYKQQMESTMVAINENSSFEEIMRALPRREREYFLRFLTSRKEERKKILKYVPSYEKRILQLLWKADDQDKNKIINKFLYNSDLEVINKIINTLKPENEIIKLRKEEFRTLMRQRKILKGKEMPSRSWKGWKPQQNLEFAKIRTLKAYGVDISQAGYTKYDLQATRTPYTVNGFKAVPLRPFKIKETSGIVDRIKSVFKVSSIKNSEVVAIPNNMDSTTVNLQLKIDNIGYIQNLINSI